MSEEKVVVEVSEEVPAPPTSAPPTDEAVAQPTSTEEQPAAAATDAPMADDAEPKKEEEKKPEEPPADIREEPIKWLMQQIPPAVHKVNYFILDWIQKTVVDDEAQRAPLPGKNGAVTKNQFINFLKDGHLLASMANKFSPGAVETVHEGEALKNKENQKANVEGFVEWAKSSLGLPEDQVMTAGDLLEKGKAGYPAVFGTLWQLATGAKEKFDKDGIDVDAVVDSAGQAVKSNLIQTILGFFKRARPQTPQSEKQAAMEAEEKERAEKEKAKSSDVVEQVEEPVVKVEQQAAAPAPVPAN